MRRKKKRVPVVLQMEALECGAASLAMILGTYGKYVPLEQLRLDCGVSRDGSNAKNIAIAAKHHGMQVHGYRYDAETLMKERRLPAIIHWNFNHFVVLVGFQRGYAILNDPAIGRVRVSLEQFRKQYTGVILVLEPGERFEPSGHKKSAFRFILHCLRGYKKSSLILILTGLMLAAGSMTLPVFSKIFMDDILLGKSQTWMFQLTESMLVVILLIFGLHLFQTGLLNRMKGKMTVEMGMGFLWHTLTLPISFFMQRAAGDISRRQEDNDKVVQILFEKLIPAVIQAVMSLVYFAILLYYSVPMALLVFGLVSLNLLAVSLAAKQNENDSRNVMRDEGKLAGAAMAGISMIETIKASGAEQGYFGKITGYQAKYNNAQGRLKGRQLLIDCIPMLIDDFSGACILILGVQKILNGEFTIGLLISFQGFYQAFVNPIGELVGVWGDIQKMGSMMERLSDVREYKADVGMDTIWQEKEAASTERLSGKIDLEGIDFGYQPLSAPLIQDFNLHIQAGETVALVGGSGSGKSTIASLVTGLYEVQAGSIRYDGWKRSEIDRYVFVNSMRIVDQNIVIFQDTIRNNITLWEDGVEEQRLIRACRDAGIYEDIMKRPEGFEYLLSEGGSNLSGGQRQRIEIARALLTEPAILILDEATSALDPLTELEIIKAIRRRKMTCLIIAHRLSTIRDADQIIVLEKGKEVERGTHETLLQKNGIYAGLIQEEA